MTEPVVRQSSVRAGTLVRQPSVQVSDLEQNRKFMDLYSRQIGAFGLEAMVKLTSLRVLLVGLRGVGVEVAKNIILAGVHELILYDPTPVQIRDLGSNFFFAEKDETKKDEGDIGKPRAQVCAPKLAELNRNVRVEAYDGEFNEAFVKHFNAVVFTQGDKATWMKWNEFCRSQTKTVLDERGYPSQKPAPIAFISCFSAGACGSVFSDFGPGFVIRDSDGVEPFIKIVVGLEQKEERKVSEETGKEVVTYYTLVRYLTPVGQVPGSILDDTLVSFSEVEGMYSRTDPLRAKSGLSINTSGSWRCWHPEGDPVNTLRIGDTRGYSPYISGGIITQVKEPKHVSFRSLAECTIYPSSSECGVISDPEKDFGFAQIDMMSAFSPGGPEQQLHIAVQAAMNFQLKFGRPPNPNDAADSDACVALAHEFNNAMGFLNANTPFAARKAIHVDTINEQYVRHVARMSTLDLQPMCTFFGGVIAQELVKLSGKFRPLNQFLNYQVFDALPSPVPADVAPLGCRYDDQIAIYGKAFQERLCNLKVFMVGCGALGCEYAKNFALTGICCGPEGMLTVTDNDRIELSNLNRQFLFREENRGSAKSVTAGKRAQAMNRAMRVTSLEQLLAPSTEHIFNDEFWLGQDVVCNALDNMEARLYSDSKCVLYHKPLLESATMGTGANVDVVVPKLTESYAKGGKTGEQGGIPMCTLRNFPHLIEHCIEWSRAMFTDLFDDPIRKAAVFLEDPVTFLAKQRDTTLGLPLGSERANAVANALPKLRTLERTVRQACASPNIKDCVALAFELFHTLFRDPIVDLTTRFPEHTKAKTGEPFWSGHRKFPKAQAFDVHDSTHVDFVIAAANLMASVLKVHGPKHPSEQNDPAHRWMAEYRDPKWIAQLVSKLAVPAYTKGAVAHLDDESASDGVADDSANAEQQLEAVLHSLETLSRSPQNRGLVAADFEKDDDDNFHIDFVTAAANLRAANYHIPSAPRHKCKMIAGRIIPAVATTTASVTGLVVLELYKFLQGRPIEAFRNGNFDIGSNTYMMFEPSPATQVKTKTSRVFKADAFEKAIKVYQAQVTEKETRIASLKELLAGVGPFTDNAELLQPMQDALKEAEQGLAEMVAPVDTDYYVTDEVKAYPNPHTLWDQLAVPPSVVSLRAMVAFFKEQHGLTVSSLSMKTSEGKGLQLYPAIKPINLSLLPSFDVTQGQATMAIMRDTRIREKQRYINKWAELKAQGASGAAAAAAAAADPVPMVADEDLPLRELFQLRAGLDLAKRRRLLLEDITLADDDGETLETAKVVLHFS